MKHKYLIILLIIISSFCFSQTAQEEYMKEREQVSEEYKQTRAEAYKEYHLQQDSLFIQYQQEIEKYWNEFKESTQEEWVSYNPDFTSRSNVNFEEGVIRIDAIAKDSQNDEEVVNAVVEQLIAINLEEDETNNPILKDQVQNPLDKTETITETNVKKIAQDLVKNSKKTIVTGKDGERRTQYSISLNMVPNHIKIRADKYRSYIEDKCNDFDIDPAFVMAIIHTESYFNPKAYNRHGNAYGMMQIVPKYAGLTMNNVLYKNNRKPTSGELFDPHKNLKMGISYMRWLADNKWEKVKGKTNLYYCIICSYNGGPGTIYKAMTGKMKKIGQEKWDQMFVDLNTMESSELYKLLRKKVPWEETRKYLKLVMERKEKFYNKL